MSDVVTDAIESSTVAASTATAGRLDRLRHGLHRLLFRPVSAFPLAIVRIGVGFALVLWTTSMAFDVGDLLDDDAIVGPEFATAAFGIELTGDVAIRLALVGLALAGLAVLLGFRPALFAVIAFVLLTLLQRRNPVILNSGDLILRNLTVLLALTPCGAALSIDRLRRHGRVALRTAPRVAPWGLRLIQLQVVVVYLFAVWGKSGASWTSGTAVSTAFRLEDLQRFGAPSFLVESVLIVAALTWGTLVVELALATLLWVRRARPILIVVGVLLHVLIDVFLLVGVFGITMIAGLMAFLDGDAVQRRLARDGP
ncbi:MAG: HTTM domain-containing protein [Actinomycetota bacterium]